MAEQIPTRQILSCAKRVHHVLGAGFTKEVYQQALSYELKDENVQHVRNVGMPIFYKDIEVGKHRIDFMIQNLLSIEIIVADTISYSQLFKTKNYLEACNIKMGLLINFGVPEMYCKKVHNSLFREIKSDAINDQ